jgi:hypothetical protein
MASDRVERRGTDDAPEISVVEAPAGRETLAVIAEEARQVRPAQDTLNYGDRISNAPGAKTPSSALASTGQVPFAIFEMLTFIVQGQALAELASETARRRFVEQHLRHRLPAGDMTRVERVDITPGTVHGTVVIRVWCKLDPG